MKTTMPHLGFILCLLAAPAFAADEPPATRISDNNPAAQKPSVPISQQITAGLKYAPPAPAPAEPKPGDAVKPGETSPDLLVLPKMTVKQKPRPRLTPDTVYTKQGLGEQLAKQKYTTLDRALNKFTLPLFGTSIEARAYDDYQREKKEQLNADVSAISKAVEVADPAEAKALRDAAAKP